MTKDPNKELAERFASRFSHLEEQPGLRQLATCRNGQCKRNATPAELAEINAWRERMRTESLGL